MSTVAPPGRRSPDVVIIGAGIVGAACARELAMAGLRVAVVERGTIAGGTSGAGEGNVLVSDKVPGPELDLAMLSSRLWSEVADELGAEAIEYEPKGGVVVARSTEARAGLRQLTERQRLAGVQVSDVDLASLRELEPNIGPSAESGAWYPQDAQVQPMLATAHLLRSARALGATVHTGVAAIGFRGDGPAVDGVLTDSPLDPVIPARWVVNAAGVWAGEVASLAGCRIPVLPRRGFVLVTEPLPRVIRHKVYAAEYLANVASGDAGLETSVVVEGTRSGTVLIGASREGVGFDRTISVAVVRRLAAQAIELFPFLVDVALLRTYLGFRPFCPDHLPVIGADPRTPGVIHACGHEGAGIGLAPATARLVAELVTGRAPSVDPAPFCPARFAATA